MIPKMAGRSEYHRSCSEAVRTPPAPRTENTTQRWRGSENAAVRTYTKVMGADQPICQKCNPPNVLDVLRVRLLMINYLWIRIPDLHRCIESL
jgi:hypothetical protein